MLKPDCAHRTPKNKAEAFDLYTNNNNNNPQEFSYLVVRKKNILPCIESRVRKQQIVCGYLQKSESGVGVKIQDG